MSSKPVVSQLVGPDSFVGNVVVWGESKVGKTRFLDTILQDLHYYPFLGTAPGVRHTLVVDNNPIEANYLDLSSTTIRTADRDFQPELFTQTLSSAVGVVLLYDMTSLDSFERVTNQAYTYACMCNQYMGTGERKNCEFILVGTKKDAVERNAREREVDTDLAEQWADSQGMRHFELTSFDKEEVQEAVCELLRAVSRSEKRRQGVGGNEESQSIRSNNSVREQMKRVFGKLKSSA